MRRRSRQRLTSRSHAARAAIGTVAAAVGLLVGLHATDADSAVTLCVNPGGTGGCSSSIQDAIDAAPRAATIDVAAGTYLENLVIPTRQVVTVRGAGPGATVVDGGATDRVLQIADRTVVSLSGLTLRNGIPTPFDGGGLQIAARARVSLADCAIEDNAGHGVFAGEKAEVTIAQSAITDNAGVGFLGTKMKRLTMTDVDVAGNGSDGILVGGRASIVRADVSGNGRFGIVNASNWYGGPTIDLRVADSWIHDNAEHGILFSGGSGQDGTGSGRFALERSIVTGNQGGGVAVRHSRVEILATTISGNTGGNGGGLHIGNSTAGRTMVANSTISSNSGATGGGVYVGGSAPNRVTFSHTTIAGNAATVRGGGIALVGSGFARPVLEATIVGDNAAPAGPDCSAELVTRGGNLIENVTGCTLAAQPTDVTGADPLLGPLADNGGTTETHALLPGSPALGIVTQRSLCRQPDQRGVARTAPCDSGAYEAP